MARSQMPSRVRGSGAASNAPISARVSQATSASSAFLRGIAWTCRSRYSRKRNSLDRREPGIAGAHAGPAPLDLLEEREDQRRVDVLEREVGGRSSQPVGREAQQGP